MITTKNEVVLRGFVGRYVHLPKKRGDPARFDLGTVERLRTDDGELITKKNWHTIKTYDVDKVDEEVITGTILEVTGRMDTDLVDGKKVVEIVADQIEILLTQAERNILRGGEISSDE